LISVIQDKSLISEKARKMIVNKIIAKRKKGAKEIKSKSTL